VLYKIIFSSKPGFILETSLFLYWEDLIRGYCHLIQCHYAKNYLVVVSGLEFDSLPTLLENPLGPAVLQVVGDAGLKNPDAKKDQGSFSNPFFFIT
jgi:hypothetical protein